MTNGEIRRRLGVSLDAVKYHVSNALGKLSLNTRSDLKHWHGAPSDSALHAGTHAMVGSAGLGPIGQISHQVRDLDAAVMWYRDVLGLTHLFTFGTLAFFDCHGIRLFLSAGEKKVGEPGDSILYFRTDDIEAAHRQLTERGVTFRGAPHMIHRHAFGRGGVDGVFRRYRRQASRVDERGQAMIGEHKSRRLVAFAGSAAAIVLALLLASNASAQSVVGRSSSGLFYEVSGAGEPVVFIHGFSLDRRMWDPQVAAFEGRYRVIRYDLRGHGDSVASGEPYTGHDDLQNVLDALGISRATLVGLSAGSELAINFAITHPDRVARLVLASPGLGGYRGSPLPWLQPVLDAAAAGDAEGAAQLWTKTPLMTLMGDVGAAPAVTAMVMRNARLWTSKRTERPLSPPAAGGRLSAITCPVLVIIGDEDLPHIREIARVITEGVAGAARTVIPRAGHLVNLDAPGAFNEVVWAFLAHP